MNDFDFDGFVQADDEALDCTTGRESGEMGERTMGFVRMNGRKGGYVPMPGSIEEQEMAEKRRKARRRKARRMAS